MNMSNISVIILLFHTRDNLIENLKQYKDFKVLILDQSNDLELKKKIKGKILHELSFGTWLIHISSVVEWIYAIFIIKKISNFEKYKTYFWLSLAMIPNLISAMCAITWHIFDNQESLYGLVTLQGILTFIGNSTLAIATIVIYKTSYTYE